MVVSIQDEDLRICQYGNKATAREERTIDVDKPQITYRVEQGESMGPLHAVLIFSKWVSGARGI